MLLLVWILAQVAAPAGDTPLIERDCLRQLLSIASPEGHDASA